MSDGTRWFFRTPGRLPTLYDREPFWQRHFWPPSAFGMAVYVVVISVFIAFVGTYIWARADANSTRPVEPNDQTPAEAVGITGTEGGSDATTTTMAPVLSPEDIARKVAPSVWTVRTLDQGGRAVQGSAFVAGSFSGQTLLVTSLAVVRAATQAPSPTIDLQQGGNSTVATLWTWDEGRDLALLVIRGSSPQLTWASDSPVANPNDKAYAVGAAGSSRPLGQGIVVAVTAASVQHSIFIDENLQGAPLVNDKGEVLGIASQVFDEGGRGTDTLFFAVPIRAACERVLQCGGGNLTPDGPGASGSTTTTRPGSTTTTRPGTTTTLPRR